MAALGVPVEKAGHVLGGSPGRLAGLGRQSKTGGGACLKPATVNPRSATATAGGTASTGPSCAASNDPERLGRVRLEIPAVLGSGRRSWSEWAAHLFPLRRQRRHRHVPGPRGRGLGLGRVRGRRSPVSIWTGVWLAKSSPGNNPRNPSAPARMSACHDCEDKVEHQANRHDDLEHKKYYGHPPARLPARQGPAQDRDRPPSWPMTATATSCYEIIDRAGQILTMEGKVKPEMQSNALRRGTKDAEKGDQLDIASQIVGSAPASSSPTSAASR